MPMHTRNCYRTYENSTFRLIVREMRSSDRYGVCRICMMEAGLALLSSFSSFPSSSYYPHRHQTNPTLLCTWAHFGPLHLIGGSTKTHLQHKDFFSTFPCHIAGALLMAFTLLISSTSSSHY